MRTWKVRRRQHRNETELLLDQTIGAGCCLKKAVVRLKHVAVVGNHEHFVGVNLSLLAAFKRA